jgi:hypothetical protein
MSKYLYIAHGTIVEMMERKTKVDRMAPEPNLRKKQKYLQEMLSNLEPHPHSVAHCLEKDLGVKCFHRRQIHLNLVKNQGQNSAAIAKKAFDSPGTDLKKLLHILN